MDGVDTLTSAHSFNYLVTGEGANNIMLDEGVHCHQFLSKPFDDSPGSGMVVAYKVQENIVFQPLQHGSDVELSLDSLPANL